MFKRTKTTEDFIIEQDISDPQSQWVKNKYRESANSRESKIINQGKQILVNIIKEQALNERRNAEKEKEAEAVFSAWKFYDILATVFAILGLLVAIINYELNVAQGLVVAQFPCERDASGHFTCAEHRLS